MAFTFAKGSVTDMSAFRAAMEREGKSKLFFEVYEYPTDGQTQGSAELYQGWIVIHLDGTIEFGHPG